MYAVKQQVILLQIISFFNHITASHILLQSEQFVLAKQIVQIEEGNTKRNLTHR